jgi:DNA-binding NarL/FixJ family response regulator
MARTGTAAQGSGGEPMGEKHSDAGGMSGHLASQPILTCDLCARLSSIHRLRNRRSSAPGPLHALRIALVDDDPGTRAIASEMIRQQHDGWTFAVYTTPERGHSCSRALPSQDFGLRTQDYSRPKTQDSTPHDVVLIGLRDSDLFGLACVRKLKGLAPDLPVVVISERCDGATIAQYCMARADGYLLKPIALEELVRAIDEVVQGKRFLCGKTQAAVVDYLCRLGTTRLCTVLSSREREVMLRIISGGPNKVIASELGVSAGTLHWHLDNIFKKLGVHSKDQARSKFARG